MRRVVRNEAVRVREWDGMWDVRAELIAQAWNGRTNSLRRLHSRTDLKLVLSVANALGEESGLIDDLAAAAVRTPYKMPVGGDTQEGKFATTLRACAGVPHQAQRVADRFYRWHGCPAEEVPLAKLDHSSTAPSRCC